MDITNLRDLLPKPCDPLTNGVVPYYNVDSCKRETRPLPNLDTYDCTFVENCMSSAINGIDNQITNITGIVNGHTLSINNLLSVAHDHTNYALLQSLYDTGGGDMFLSNDGTYKGIDVASYYQRVQTNGINASQRFNLNFAPEFTITDDPANGRTTISLTSLSADAIQTCSDVHDCMSAIINGLQNQINQNALNLTNLETELDNEVLNLQQQITNHITADEIMTCADVMACPGISSLVSSIGDSYVDSSWDSGTNTITFVTGDGGTDTLTLTGITGITGIDERVKASATDPIAGYLDVKVKNSVMVDNNQIQLVNDVAAPGNNYVYGTGPTGIKGWRLDAGATEQTFNCVAVVTRTCVHSLNAHPAVVCVDGTGNLIVPDTVLYSDANTVVVGFLTPFTGNIYIR